MFSIRTVLVPMDFSACALAALDHAADLARPQRGTILLLHVVTPTASGLAEAESIGPEVVSRFEDRLRQLADRLRAERLNAEPLVLIGSIEDEILTMASRRGVDLIVIGTHGHSGWGHLLLGSMAERIVRRAECPVLTVKDHVVARSLEVEVDAGEEASE